MLAIVEFRLVFVTQQRHAAAEGPSEPAPAPKQRKASVASQRTDFYSVIADISVRARLMIAAPQPHFHVVLRLLNRVLAAPHQFHNRKSYFCTR